MARLQEQSELIPNAPDLSDFAAEIAGSASSTADLGGRNTTCCEQCLTCPVVEDKFAIRVVGYDYDNSGYYQNVAGDETLLRQCGRRRSAALLQDAEVQVSDQYTGGRITALWQVSQDFNA